MPASVNASMIPMCDHPRAAPLPRARPIRVITLLSLVFSAIDTDQTPGSITKWDPAYPALGRCLRTAREICDATTGGHHPAFLDRCFARPKPLAQPDRLAPAAPAVRSACQEWQVEARRSRAPVSASGRDSSHARHRRNHVPVTRAWMAAQCQLHSRGAAQSRSLNPNSRREKSAMARRPCANNGRDMEILASSTTPS